MQYSTNNKLKLMEGTDNVRRQDFVDNFNAIDNGLSKFYVATLNSTNVYKISTGLSKTSLANGYSVKVAIPSDSTRSVSLIVDSCSPVSIKKPNGTSVTNFKANGVYQLVYYNSVFILASGGVDDVSFSASDLLENKSANNSNGEKVDGTMPNRGAVTATINAGGNYTIPAGYHNGNGKVTANSLASQTPGTATAPNIGKGLTAWVNGTKLTGTGDILKTKTITMKASDFSYQNNSDNNGYTIYLNNVFSATNMSGVTTMLYGEVTGSVTYSYYKAAQLKTDGSRTFTYTYGKTSTFYSDSCITLVSVNTGSIGCVFNAFITRTATFTIYYI